MLSLHHAAFGGVGVCPKSLLQRYCGNDNNVGGEIFPSLLLCGLHFPALTLTASVGTNCNKAMWKWLEMGFKFFYFYSSKENASIIALRGAGTQDLTCQERQLKWIYFLLEMVKWNQKAFWGGLSHWVGSVINALGFNAIGSTGTFRHRATSGLFHSLHQMIGFILLPLGALLKALHSLQTYILALEKLLLRSEAPLVKLGPALGWDKQAQIHFPDCNTGESGRVGQLFPHSVPGRSW